MAYIQPSSTILLMSGVPLDASYEHSVDFPNLDAQANAFKKYVRYTLNDNSYVRRTLQSVRVPLTMEQAIQCNYMSFNNREFENKTFYAFITNWEYVNNETTDIYYQLDLLQSWMFDYNPAACYIARETVLMDVLGKYLIPEGLEQGEYVYKQLYQSKDFFKNWYPAALCTFDEKFQPASGDTDKLAFYNGLHTIVFADYQECNNFLIEAANRNKSDGIVSIQMVPEPLRYATSSSTFVRVPSPWYGTATLADGYVPRNKKLLTYPYNTIYVTDCAGSAANYPYEYFAQPSGNNPTFEAFLCHGIRAGLTQFNLQPLNFKGVLQNYNEQLQLDLTPQCAFATDSYRAWLAQNASGLAITQGYLASKNKTLNWGAIGDTLITTAGAIGGIVGGAIAKSPTIIAGSAGAGLSSLKSIGQNAWTSDKDIEYQIAQSQNTQYVASTMPPQARGTSSGGLAIVDGYYGFNVYQASCSSEFAQCIDSFFDMYGYQVNYVGKPTHDNRKTWDFVRTANYHCEPKSFGFGGVPQLPASDAAAIENIFNNGITFWHNIDNMRDYSLPNPSRLDGDTDA